MYIFYRPYTDPYLNIAAEEYFVKNFTENICMLWVNEPAVIIGKHQNAYAEINYPFVKAKQIPVIRRISGGGAVYHDTGNVNFSFILKTGKNNQVDFGRFTTVMVQFMQSIGIDVNVNERNSLFVGAKKFSGHAEHVFHDRVLHHGTILWDTNLEVLNNCLIPAKQFSSKAMASVRSEVCNLAPLLPAFTSIQQFINELTSWLRLYFNDSKPYAVSQHDLEAISKLAKTRYKTWQWNFGYSPSYKFKTDIHIHAASYSLLFEVENGKIVEVIVPDEIKKTPVAILLSGLAGVLHREEDIENFISNNQDALELEGIKTVEWVHAFFSA